MNIQKNEPHGSDIHDTFSVAKDSNILICSSYIFGHL
jgi:hypothetical protein